MFGQNAPPFYSVLGSSGSSPTPPINYIGATPQLNFATILNTGGFLGNSPATGTVLADGVSYDGAAWTAKDTGAVALQMNGALPGIVLYANSGLTPGVAYGPTAAVTWLGPGNPWTFTDKIDVASLPAADATNAGILTGPGVDQTVGGGTRTWQRTAVASTAETLAIWKLSDDAVGSVKFANATNVDGRFAPRIAADAPSTEVPLQLLLQPTTDSGSNPIFQLFMRTTAAATITARPLVEVSNNGNTLLQLLPLNSGANAALSWGTQAVAVPSFTNRSLGTRLVLYNSLGASAADHAIGVESNNIWFSVADTNGGFKFYSGTTNTLKLGGNGLLTTTGGKVRKTRIALTTPVTVAVTDDIVEVNLTTPGAVTINYPATPTTGTEFVLQDGKGDAGANNHTHTPAAGNINGAGTKVYSANYYRATAFYNGTQWLIG